MDQSTHEIRRINWMNIINQCKNRPANMTAKQCKRLIVGA